MRSGIHLLSGRQEIGWIPSTDMIAAVRQRSICALFRASADYSPKRHSLELTNTAVHEDSDWFGCIDGIEGTRRSGGEVVYNHLGSFEWPEERAYMAVVFLSKTLQLDRKLAKRPKIGGLEGALALHLNACRWNAHNKWGNGGRSFHRISAACWGTT
jgi:hypothetical protein